MLNNKDFIGHHPSRARTHTHTHTPDLCFSQFCLPLSKWAKLKELISQREFKYWHLVRPALPHLRIPYSVSMFQVSQVLI